MLTRHNICLRIVSARIMMMEVILLIQTTCSNCHCVLFLSNYRLFDIDSKIVVREYFGCCSCGHIVRDEDFREEDQIYLDVPGLLEL